MKQYLPFLIILTLFFILINNISAQKLTRIRVNTLMTTYTSGVYNGTLEVGLEVPIKHLSVSMGPSIRYGKSIYLYDELSTIKSMDVGVYLHIGVLNKLYLGGGAGVTRINYNIDNVVNSDGILTKYYGKFNKLRFTGTIQYIIVEQGGITLNFDYLIGNIKDMGGVNHNRYITNFTINFGFAFIINYYHK